MSGKLMIYGASDDLLEVEGDIRDEANVTPSGEFVVAVSDGTMLGVRYDEHGCWRIVRLAQGAAHFAKVYEGVPDGEEPAGAPDPTYSDRVELALDDGRFDWCVVGGTLMRRKA